MADTKKTQRSFFDWVWPGDAALRWWMAMAFLILLLLLGLLFMVVKPARQLSIDGGGDEIAAGLPYFDGGIPKDQIAAGYPLHDDPELIPVAPADGPSRVDEEGEDGEDEDGDPTEEPTDGAPISDEPSPENAVAVSEEVAVEEVAVVPALRIGTWDLVVTEWGEAVCGYPVDPYTYAATLTISEGANEDGEDPYEIRLEMPFQIFIGSGISMPISLTASGEGWTEVRTIEELDVERGVLLATSTYETDDCLAERFLEAVDF